MNSANTYYIYKPTCEFRSNISSRIEIPIFVITMILTAKVNKINSRYVSWLDFHRREFIFMKIQPRNISI